MFDFTGKDILDGAQFTREGHRAMSDIYPQRDREANYFDNVTLAPVT